MRHTPRPPPPPPLPRQRPFRWPGGGGVQTARCLGLSPGRRADWELRAPAAAAVEASRGPRAEFMDIADRAEGIPEESVCENEGTGARQATG